MNIRDPAEFVGSERSLVPLIASGPVAGVVLVVGMFQAADASHVKLMMDLVGFALVSIVAFMLLFMTGLVYVPVGYERGKIKWFTWCGTGMHSMTVYWTENGFQTLHPKDRNHE